jgi:D-xylose reductase
MEELVIEGLVRNIGVANIGVSLLRDLLNYAKVKPTVINCEMHPYFSQEKLLRFCRTKGITVSAFMNFGQSTPREASCLNDKIVFDIAN